MKILIAEDVAVLRLQMTKALNHAGFEVHAVSDGEGVISTLSFQRERFFCLLLDLNLPGMSGEEILGWLSANKMDLPVIICSGALSRERILQISQLYGIAHVLPKPFDYNVLRKKLLGLYPSYKTALFVSTKSETMFLLQSFFDRQKLRLIWCPNVTNIYTDDDVKIFNFGLTDRDFREILDCVDWDSLSGLKYLMGNKKVAEHGEKISGAFDGIFSLPFEFSDMCSTIEQALFPKVAESETKEEKPTTDEEPENKNIGPTY